MKNIKYLLLLLLGFTVMYACDEDDAEVYDIPGGKNLAIFELSKTSLTRIADGAEHAINVKMKLQGPSLSSLKSDVTVTVAADASSTAVEGVHYRIDVASFDLVPGQRFVGLYSGVTMLTEGIMTPLDKSPVLVLKVTAVSGDNMVIASGKTLPITLNYACPSDLGGAYNVTVTRNGLPRDQYFTDTFTNIGVGTYRTTNVGGWTQAQLGGTPGFTFTDVCGVITVPQQNLVDLYSNQVQSFQPGSVDEATGIVTIHYNVNDDVYVAIFVPVD